MADINEVIGGYRLRTLLQTGQKSQVFEVVETRSNRHFAMKVLLPEAATEPEARAELFNDAEVGVKMAHANVIRIHKVERSKERPFFVMEFFPSGSLRLRLQAKDTKFIKEHARKIFREAATGLAYMNAMGYVHRDVKPDNILVNSMGDTKIIDFALTTKAKQGGGLSGLLGKLLGKKERVGGTKSYMSPEQILKQPLDGRADLYSYGVTLFELTTGRKPFVGMTEQELLTKHFTEKPQSPVNYNKELTDEFGQIVLKMLAKKREDRFAGFHEFLIALRKVKIYKDEKVEDEG
ncbi:serine/threonine protein kinase [Urbifossiella limnaea]|uniref:Serine/threonine-protein kinase PknB n=1 Tax=Urbifossiella limnaea TaxID=2528023 RepID=A0A517XUE7_9BACT|nr:serine/threonine-protein kinase [Urbifossiella limnaea]QDU21131.1 Serine/threonine-protein kinase PknB [Urbifossiella limnaea]